MNELALFAGAGGGILGGILSEWRTVCAVEIDPYAASVLIARQNEGLLPPFPVWDDVRTFNGLPWKGSVDVVSGGFPCQDISTAGKGEGIEGKRSGLWREMARIVGEVRPQYVFVENSPALVGRGLAMVLGDLAQMGFDAKWGCISAADVGAPHKRERIWIVAYPNGNRLQKRRLYLRPGKPPKTSRISFRESQEIPNPHEINGYDSRHGTGKIQWDRSQEAEVLADSPGNGREPRGQGNASEGEKRREFDRSGIQGNISDSDRTRLEIGESQPGNHGEEFSPLIGIDWWDIEPGMGRVANGVADRVDRLKAIGNGQVPAVARLAWELLNK